MARFNSTVKPSPVVNRAGGKAFKQDAELALASLVLTSLVQDQHYRSAVQTMQEVRTLVDSVDSTFAAKTALFARHTYGLRSISHIVAAEIARSVKGERWTRPFFRDVVSRPDDITEILSYYMTNYGKPLPNSLKDGLGQSFAKFNAYQLAKYRQDGKSMSLVDAVRLTHAKPVGKNANALTDLVYGRLATAETWESGLSAAGSDEELKKEVWVKLLSEGKLGFFALLRNLRNIIQTNDTKLISMAATELTVPDKVKNSGVLPFQFFKAYEALAQLPSVPQNIQRALETAYSLVLENVPHFDDTTVIMVDISGSMRSHATNAGVIASALVRASDDARVILFSDNAEWKNVDSTISGLALVKQFVTWSQGGGTAMGSAFQLLLEDATIKPSRIVVVSDMQTWAETRGYAGYYSSIYGKFETPNKLYDLLNKKYDEMPMIYAVDLSGYGTTQFPFDRVFQTAGFTDKMFEVMQKLENNRNALVDEIKAYPLELS